MPKTERVEASAKPINLSELLRPVSQYQREQDRASEQAADQRAADLVVKSGGHVDLSSTQKKVLERVRRSELYRGQVQDHQVRHLLSRHWGEADAQLHEERFEREGMACLEPNVWEFSWHELLKRFKTPIEDETFEDRVRSYVGHIGPGDEPDEFTTEMARIDGEGFANQLLASIWENYPAQASEIGLPDPQPPTPQGLAESVKELASVLSKNTVVLQKAASAAEPAQLRHDAQVPKRPPDDAFIAWRLRDLKGLKGPTAIAKEMSKQLGREVNQGSVSRWLQKVDAYRKAGGIFPDLSSQIKKPHPIDPADIDMGERQDGRTPRQRQRRDPDAD